MSCLKMAIPVTRTIALMLAVVALASCGGQPSSADSAAYRKNPQTCSAGPYFEKLSTEEKLHYVFGALHARPQAACIVDLLAEQDFEFLLLLQNEIVRKGMIHDRYAFIDAVKLKRHKNALSDAELERFSLDTFCIEIDASSAECSSIRK